MPPLTASVPAPVLVNTAASACPLAAPVSQVVLLVMEMSDEVITGASVKSSVTVTSMRQV